VAAAVTALVVGCGSGSGTRAAPSFPPSTQQKLEAALTRSRDIVQFPGAVVSLYIPGEGTWETTIGVSDKTTQTPMRAGMHTRIGSVTKTFTATAILQLADDKKLNLDDAVSKYLEFVPNGQNITVRQLLNMTSGLYSYSEDDAWIASVLSHPDRTYTARQLVDVGFQHPPHFNPGTNIKYSNSNYVLLGLIVEKVSQRKLEDFFAERIFRPLHLSHTSWPTNAALPTPFSRGYTEQTPTGKEADATFFNPSWGNAAGQMISDLEDLKKWTVALGEGTLLSPQMQQERLTWAPFGSEKLRYGLGIGYYNGWVGHTGELPGYNTGVYYLPGKKAVLVIQINADIPLVITPGNPPVQENPVPALFREIAKVVTPGNIPDGPELPSVAQPE
jgi:D-alanyl-D-alanine carboxypeptidase